MECRWPPPMGMPVPNNFGQMRPPFYHPRIPVPFSPQTCWAPFPGNPWQNEPPPHPRGHHPERNNKNTNKKQKKEPVFIDYCDVCDRGFKNLAKKAEHFKQHTKCNEPGCNFEAHFKIVAIHRQNLHGPNAFKIKLDTPEDIQRWRNERKRKYPTVSNVELKAKNASEQRELGNVLENRFFGKIHRKKARPCNPKSENEHTSSAEVDIQPVQKTLNLLFCNPVNASDDSASTDEEPCATKVISHAGTSIGLGSLMQSYASSSEDEATDMVVETKSTKNTNMIPQLQNEVKVERSKEKFSPNKEIKTNFPAGGNRQQGRDNFVCTKRQSLLEMLLGPEIRRERNHILQCVRFIAKNKFFEDDLVVCNGT